MQGSEKHETIIEYAWLPVFVPQVSQTKHIILKKLREVETQNQDKEKETSKDQAAQTTPKPTKETGAIPKTPTTWSK